MRHEFPTIMVEDEGSTTPVIASIETSPNGTPYLTLHFGDAFTLSRMAMPEAAKLCDLLTEALAPGPQPWNRPQARDPMAPPPESLMVGNTESSGGRRNTRMRRW